MSLDEQQIKGIAHLARLAIEDDDIPQYASELSNILNLVEQMSKVDTSSISPMAHPLEMTQRLRDDVVTEANLRDELQASAPAVQDGLFLVPQVIE